jgi:hypothetical protein
MNPKDKAYELFMFYYETIPYAHTNEQRANVAKKCALIAVDELIKYHDEFMDVVRYELPSNIVASIPYKYWDDVKQEIEKL